MNTETLFSTGTDDWETPPAFFAALNKEFGFTVDVAADDGNHKCSRYYTEGENGLLQDWGGETVWCNPPYSRGQQDIFVKKAYEESKKPGTTVVMLIPARTDTERFHDYILGKAEIRFIKGRIKFVGAQHGAPFPSMVVIWRSDEKPKS